MYALHTRPDVFQLNSVQVMYLFCIVIVFAGDDVGMSRMPHQSDGKPTMYLFARQAVYSLRFVQDIYRPTSAPWHASPPWRASLLRPWPRSPP